MGLTGVGAAELTSKLHLQFQNHKSRMAAWKIEEINYDESPSADLYCRTKIFLGRISDPRLDPSPNPRTYHLLWRERGHRICRDPWQIGLGAFSGLHGLSRRGCRGTD